MRERSPFVLQEDSVDPVEIQRKVEANGKSHGDDDEKMFRWIRNLDIENGSERST